MDTNDLPLKKNRKSLAPPFSQDKKKWGKVRKISMTVNLNNPQDYEGGNLKFDLGPYFKGERFKVITDMRSQGSIIIFPSGVFNPLDALPKLKYNFPSGPKQNAWIP